jgi:hypothetical protein
MKRGLTSRKHRAYAKLGQINVIGASNKAPNALSVGSVRRASPILAEK